MIIIKHTTLKQVRKNRWEDEKGNYIWKDDFGTFIIYVNGIRECAKTLERALAVMDSDRYWN